MGLVSFFAGLIEFLFNKFTILLSFLALVIAGAVVSRSSKNKDHEVTERSEAEQMRHYVSGINDDPWNSKAGRGTRRRKLRTISPRESWSHSMTGRPPRGAIPERSFTKRREQCWSGQN